MKVTTSSCLVLGPNSWLGSGSRESVAQADRTGFQVGGFLLRSRILRPNAWTVLRICDLYPGSNNNKRGGGKICCLTFSVPQISQNWKLFFLQFQEKWANWQSIIVLFTSTMFTILSEIWVGDPVSGKNLSRIGVKKAPDPQHCA